MCNLGVKMRLEQRTRIPRSAEFSPLLLPDGRKIYPINDEPAIIIIRLLIQAGKKEQPWISREYIAEALELKHPNTSVSKLSGYIAQATRILKQVDFAIISKETRLKGGRQRSYSYTLGTIEEKNARKPIGKVRPTANSHPKPPELRTVTAGKKPTPRLELPEQEAERLAKEAEEMEETRERFINELSSRIVSQIANNPDNGSHHSANLNNNLEDFLNRVNPDFKKLIGAESIDYLRNFFLDALSAKLTQWWEVKSLRNVPSLEQSAIANCMKLKNKGLNIEDVLNEVVKHFSIPIAPVNTLHS